MNSKRQSLGVVFGKRHVVVAWRSVRMAVAEVNFGGRKPRIVAAPARSAETGRFAPPCIPLSWPFSGPIL